MKVLEKNQIQMRQQQIQNEEKLQSKELDGSDANKTTQRLSKKRKAKIGRIKEDAALSPLQGGQQGEMMMAQP